MTVLHISGARSWGGNEQQLVDVIPELERLGVNNIIFGIAGSPLHTRLRKENVSFISSKEAKIHKGKNFKFLKAIVREYRPALIHLHTSDAVTLYVISDILFRLKVPAVLSKKGIGSSMSFLSIYKYNYHGIKKIIGVSNAVKKDLEKNVIKPKNHHKLTVVYDGVNLNRTKLVRKEKLRDIFNIDDDHFIIGNIANHVKAKDLGVLIEMMNYLVNKLSIKNVHLVQMGEFSGLTESLKSKVNDYALNGFVSFGGFQKNAVDFIPQFNVYVMSSEREGLPITIFESFYKKTPVVSTMAGGIPEAIVDSQNGFLVEKKDYKALAEKVQRLLNDQELADVFTTRSNKIFYERFIASVTAENTLKVYNDVIK